MELITAFVSLVGLLAIWKGERSGIKSQDMQQFLEWLRRHDHEQLLNLIQTNTEIGTAIQSLLENQHEEVLQRFTKLDATLASVASRISGFEGLALAMRTQPVISEQAFSILAQMNTIGTSALLEVRTREGLTFIPADRHGPGNVTIAEPRFIEDDMMVLVELGLLRLDYGSKGSRIFRITREGAALGSK